MIGSPRKRRFYSVSVHGGLAGLRTRLTAMSMSGASAAHGLWGTWVWSRCRLHLIEGCCLTKGAQDARSGYSQAEPRLSPACKLGAPRILCAMSAHETLSQVAVVKCMSQGQQMPGGRVARRMLCMESVPRRHTVICPLGTILAGKPVHICLSLDLTLSLGSSLRATTRRVARRHAGDRPEHTRRYPWLKKAVFAVSQHAGLRNRDWTFHADAPIDAAVVTKDRYAARRACSAGSRCSP